MKQQQYQEIERRLWSNCLKSPERKTKVTEFQQAARELCESITGNDNIMRQVLPEGFTENEVAIVREEAALLGLNIATCERYGKKQIYIQKS